MIESDRGDRKKLQIITGRATDRERQKESRIERRQREIYRETEGDTERE